MRFIPCLAFCGAFLSLAVPRAGEMPAVDPLPSWSAGAAKRRLVRFVEEVTRPGSPDFVPVSERIAVFDNDGTLWPEQPMYTQLAFLLDRLKTLAPEHPEWRIEQPFRAALSGNLKILAGGGSGAESELLAVTHSGMTTEEFEHIVSDWMARAHHPRFDRRYDQLAYQPMLELLGYLRASGFRTYIVSGGGAEFMRPWTEAAYGVPPEQVIGSSSRLRFEVQKGRAVLMRLPEVDFIDDKEGKPVGIQKFIGRYPIVAFGNSDGDLQMLEYTAAGKRPHLVALVHHTDARREYAYDRLSIFGRLSKALDEAEVEGWLVVDMKNDWKTIFRTP